MKEYLIIKGGSNDPSSAIESDSFDRAKEYVEELLSTEPGSACAHIFQLVLTGKKDGISFTGPAENGVLIPPDTPKRGVVRRKRWTPGEIAILKQLIDEGRSLAQISVHLGRTIGAVSTKIGREDSWRK